MSKTRVWSAGAAVVGVLLIVGSWFLLIAPQRSEAASLRDQDTQQQSFNDGVRLQTKQLKAQFASLPARQAQLAEIKQEMPENPALPTLVRDLSKFADQASVTLVSVAPTAPAPSSGTAAGVAAGTAATTAAAPAAAPIQEVQTTVVASGSYAELTLYLQKLQAQMRRAVLVDNIEIVNDTASDAKAGDLQMTLSTKVFVLDTSASVRSAGKNATTSGTTASTPTTSGITPGTAK